MNKYYGTPDEALVLADWMEERGSPEAAELRRVVNTALVWAPYVCEVPCIVVDEGEAPGSVGPISWLFESMEDLTAKISEPWMGLEELMR